MHWFNPTLEAMKNLYLGRYSNHPTFQNYHDMIKENLMLLPPPKFSPTDSIEYVVQSSILVVKRYCLSLTKKRG